jgi:hypothetical protein
MQYELHCECGETLHVRETAAGAKEQCRCGRTLVVPSLHELRRSAGLPALGLSPEKVVETLLLAGKLPEEDHCILCGTPTDGLLCCRTECERAYTQRGGHLGGFTSSVISRSAGSESLRRVSQRERTRSAVRIVSSPFL